MGQTVNVAKSYFPQSVQLFASFYPFDLHKAGYELHKALQSNMDKVDVLQYSVEIQYGNRNPTFSHKKSISKPVDFLLPVARDSRGPWVSSLRGRHAADSFLDSTEST